VGAGASRILRLELERKRLADIEQDVISACRFEEYGGFEDVRIRELMSMKCDTVGSWWGLRGRLYSNRHFNSEEKETLLQMRKLNLILWELRDSGW
jgi:hypothetical protein